MPAAASGAGGGNKGLPPAAGAAAAAGGGDSVPVCVLLAATFPLAMPCSTTTSHGLTRLSPKRDLGRSAFNLSAEERAPRRPVAGAGLSAVCRLPGVLVVA